MARITFNVYDMFVRHIDEVVHEWGFQSRSDFFRFAALDFILRYKHMIPPKDVVDNYAKTVSQVRSSRRASVTDIE
jgi:metal-responsive CopG/Arc/MetJ family transcriptional regulator